MPGFGQCEGVDETGDASADDEVEAGLVHGSQDSRFFQAMAGSFLMFGRCSSGGRAVFSALAR